MTSTENDLYEQLAYYLNTRYRGVIYHFDLSGLWTPSHKLRNLYGRLNSRAWPDLFIAHPKVPDNGKLYSGLFLELKKDGTKLVREKDGTKVLNGDFGLRLRGHWWDAHIEEQAEYLAALRKAGYKAEFAVGFEQAVELIDFYLK